MSVFKVNKKRKYVNGVDYDKNTDYSLEIEKAKQSGNTGALAGLEEKRNRKIEGENLSERKTYNYIDIGTKIEEGIRSGASPIEIKELVDARRDKAYQNKQYDIYKNDEIQKKGLKYYYDAESGAGINHSNRPEEEDNYSQRIRELLDRISQAKEFKYDPESDPEYKELKNQLRNESRRAASDILAEASMQSGGQSSYAVSAASMAANNFNSKLAEHIPRLSQLAYERYLGKIGIDQKALDFTLKASEKDHEKYLDALKQFNSDREFSRENVERETERYLREDEQKFNEEQDKINDARDVVEHYEKSGVSAPDDLLKEANLSSYKEANEESASLYRRKLDLEAIVKNKQIANYNARTAKTYNDMNVSNEKLKLQKEKDTKSQNPSSENITNPRNENGILVGNAYISESEFLAMLEAGKIVPRQNPDGTVTYVMK